MSCTSFLLSCSLMWFSERSNKGGSGFVFFGTQTATQRSVAVKFHCLHDSASEVLDLASISSPNVIGVLDAGPVDADWAYFVTPHCEGGDFEGFRLSGTTTQRDSVKAIANVLVGASHLHSAQLVHRDLKPSNVFLNADGDAIIGDLGSIRRIPAGGAITGSAKTLFYVPPEVASSGCYSTQSDLYQIGLMLYRFAGGSLPHEIEPWLDKRSRLLLASELDRVRRNAIENEAVLSRIRLGRAADIASLPPHTPRRLVSVIRRSVAAKLERRYLSASAFLNELNQARAETFPWVEDGPLYILLSDLPKSVWHEGSAGYVVKAKRDAGWRKMNNGSFRTIEEAFRFAEQAR